MFHFDDCCLAPGLLEKLYEDIRVLSRQRSRLVRRKRPTASYQGRLTPKLGALYDPSTWDTDTQYPWSGSRVLIEGEDAGDSSFSRAPFAKFPESLKVFNDAVAARLALEMRRAPLDLTAGEIELFAQRKGSDPAMEYRDLDGEGRYVSISLPIDDNALAAFNSGTECLIMGENGLVETFKTHLDLAEMFETGSWIYVSTLQGSATITIKIDVTKPGCKSELATFAFTVGKGQIYAIHKSVKHKVDASFDRVAILSRPKTWKVAKTILNPVHMY